MIASTLQGLQNGLAYFLETVEGTFNFTGIQTPAKDGLSAYAFQAREEPFTTLVTVTAFTAIGLTLSSAAALPAAIPVLSASIKSFIDVSMYGLFLGFYHLVAKSIDQKRANETPNNTAIATALKSLKKTAKEKPLATLITAVAAVALGHVVTTVASLVSPIPIASFILKECIDNALKEALAAVAFTIVAY